MKLNILKNQDLKGSVMKTSVVMATYNGESFLKQQFESILMQTVLPDEIVIVDDNSSDNTSKIITDYVDKYKDDLSFNVTFRDENVGYINNFIDGINKATNDLIILCDQDDVWKKYKVERTLIFFNSYDDCMVLHTDVNLIDKNGVIIKHQFQNYKKFSAKLSVKNMVRKVNYPGMAMAFKKASVIEELNQIKMQGIVLPTHDWTIALIGCIKDGFYTSNQILTSRRHTEKNVALDINNKVLSIDKRIRGILLYERYFKFLNKLSEQANISIPLNISKYLKCSTKRIEYFTTKNFIEYFKNLFYLFYYPSIKSYIADGLLLLKFNVKDKEK